MDLLGGYGSDASSGSDASAPAPAPAPSPRKTLPATGGGSSGGGGGATGRGGPRVSRRGRRLVSLGAVLPPEIFERLTRKDAGGGDGSSSSEEEPDDGGDERGGAAASEKRKARRGGKGGRKTVDSTVRKAESSQPPRAADGAMGDLLKELGSAPRAEPGARKGVGGAAEKKPPREEKMGFSFMQSSTTVVRKKRRRVGENGGDSEGEVDDAENVHAPTEYARRKDAAEAKKREAKAVAARTEEAVAGGRPSPTASAVPRPAASASATGRISAAPTVRAAPLSSSVAAPRPVAAVPPASTHSYPAEEEENPSRGAGPTKKKSKRDLARALRSGDFSSVSSGAVPGQTVTLDQSVEHYQPSEADLTLTASRSAAAAAAQRGAAGIRMYDPSAGGDVDTAGEVDVKHRRKHQINQLAASAATLEAQRLGGMGPGGGTRTVKGSSSRADAKKRYGW